MTGLQGVALAERLKDSLPLSYLASALPVGDHASQQEFFMNPCYAARSGA